MCGQANNQKRYFYRHTHSKLDCKEVWAEARILEAQVITLLAEYLPELAEVAAKLHQVGRELETDKGEVRELEAARVEMDRLIDLRMKGYISEEEFVKFRAKAEARIEALTPAITPAVAGLEEIIDQLGELLGGLDEAEPVLQKEIIRSLLSGIEVGGQRITRITPHEWCKPLFDVACDLERGTNHVQHAGLTRLAALLDC
jgi:hypothetical protein